MAADGVLTLVVCGIAKSGSNIRSLTLTDPSGAPLPAYIPGSHLVVEAGGRRNAYSLTGDGTNPSEYEISVLRVPDGSGGSRWLHDELDFGDELRVLAPRSAFPPVARAAKHLLIAGGIGITPILSHLHAARRWGRNVQVLYTHRPDDAAHVDEVAALSGGNIEVFTARAAFMERLQVVLREQPIGTHLYVCGPAALIDHVCESAQASGWPASRVHSERFGIDALDPGDPFLVRLTESDRTVAVPSGVSMLDALEADGVSIPNLCRQGVCGECRIPLSGGTAIHRDLYLSDTEKTAADAVMPCVSRAADGDILEVPL
ncbi:PDR/VanB family oxidoreductase [Gordonia sp. ABSL1-1]|uniref:PDR/VanB family oxidoreductase n=1 Tax=Gordonia sp. ABSL1-1 TaxID=3053923 RepID=UPI0025741BB0|nr:PDR/VanB family oxidoreductase [Gordonia sp. ABSL1-1]MDL9935357.1 PDR/VanB family oxidoreductase [Gordonia sp. ABSL1-1]